MNATLETLRTWAQGLIVEGDTRGISEEDAAEAFANLDEGLAQGGFLPLKWQQD